MKKAIHTKVNGQLIRSEVENNWTLLHWIREELNLTGTKEGCNEGECGACMVLMNGKPINSCLVLAIEADQKEIVTIEGIGNDKKLHPLQQAFIKHHAVQCGYCTPGMIITALGLLSENHSPSEQWIKEALSGNLCRCTGYRQIIDAVLDAAEEMNQIKSSGGAIRHKKKPANRGLTHE